MSDSSPLPASDIVEAANHRENAAAILLKELDERQDAVLEELDQLNDSIENLIESWRSKKQDPFEIDAQETEAANEIAL